jgi:hypothetical protein
MSMHKLFMTVITVVLSSWALAAEPLAQQKSKTTVSTPAKQPAAKHAAAKPPAKPAAPKYYYVRATPLVAVPLAAAVQTPVPQAQATTPEVGEVHTGRMVCELGNSVTVSPDPQQPERFLVQMKKNTYFMTPVETTTGAVRLEDAQAGAMWLQLPHKSMLMNSKLGQRMADECQSDHQTTVAQRMKLDPPPGLLDMSTLAKK